MVADLRFRQSVPEPSSSVAAHVFGALPRTMSFALLGLLRVQACMIRSQAIRISSRRFMTCSAGSARISILPALGKTLSRCSARRSKKRTGMLILRAIPFQSLCEHQVAPIVGRAWVAYLRDRGVVGIPQAGARGRGRRSPTADSVAFDCANCQHHRPGPENQLSCGCQRLIASRTSEVIACDGDSPNALLWTPAGVSPKTQRRTWA